MMGWYGSGMSGMGFALMGVSSVLVWAVLAVAIVLVTRAVSRPSSASGSEIASRPTARQVLDERYARGEIDDEEYRRRLGVLGQ